MLIQVDISYSSSIKSGTISILLNGNIEKVVSKNEVCYNVNQINSVIDVALLEAKVEVPFATNHRIESIWNIDNEGFAEFVAYEERNQ